MHSYLGSGTSRVDWSLGPCVRNTATHMAGSRSPSLKLRARIHAALTSQANLSRNPLMRTWLLPMRPEGTAIRSRFDMLTESTVTIPVRPSRVVHGRRIFRSCRGRKRGCEGAVSTLLAPFIQRCVVAAVSLWAIFCGLAEGLSVERAAFKSASIGIRSLPNRSARGDHTPPPGSQAGI